MLHMNIGHEIGDDQELFISFDYRYDIYVMNDTTKVFTPLLFECRKPYQTIYDLYSHGVPEPSRYDFIHHYNKS